MISRNNMLQRLITPRLSGEIIERLLKQPRWTISRIARRLNSSADFVRRVQRGVQSIELADVKALANACNQDPHLFVFEAMAGGKMSEQERSLYKLTRDLIDPQKQLGRVVRRRPKRRTSAKAA
jgi:hypothetical protein